MPAPLCHQINKIFLSSKHKKDDTLFSPDPLGSFRNQSGYFRQLAKKLGFVPNLYATFALNPTALGDYLTLQNRESTLSAKEREIINLIVSEVNICLYCLSAHTVLGKMNGFSDEQILEIRSGKASFDPKFDALAKFVRAVAVHRGKPSSEVVEAFFEAGYTEANLVDALIVVGDKIISNYLHGTTHIPVDFPPVMALEAVFA
jgi:uncharacterized peroxidase-related enzyme